MTAEEVPPSHPVDEGSPLRIVIIGAGVSGIALYIRLLQHVPSAQVTIVEKNPVLGGTWYENRYPGVACDIPSHVYQYSFEPNPNWTKLFSTGAEILEYVKSVASKYKVDQKIKYNTKVVKAAWNAEEGIWTIKTEHSEPSGGVVPGELSAEVILSAVGIFNHWKWPDVEGLHDFQGKLLHSANWDDTWDYTGKTVALLGCGSSAIQILPHLQQKCPEVINFVRGGTWISQPFGSTLTEKVLAKGTEPGNYTYTEDERKQFAEDPEHYLTFRREMESFVNKDFPSLFAGSHEEKVSTQKIKDVMKEKLMAKPGLYDALEPNFTPGCRRLTPGPGYLEAIVQENVQLVKSPIVHVTQNSVITQDGNEYKVDAIACATGFDCSHMPRFPIIGKNGQSLNSRWEERASAYLSHSIPGVPNYFTVAGPNSSTGGGSLLLILESVMGYIIKAVQKISREHIKSMEVKEEALAAWVKNLDNYFPGTVHMESCTSWYKINDKIIGLWPGSSLHAMKTLEHPRWEDYQYEYAKEPNYLNWIGNGWTKEDVRRGELGYYVDLVDIPPVPTDETITKQP
ncbi:putative monooxygenase [Xylariales sp. PMI_506]|nr:putative monooxygenase [Xylariales sp. PMI_506]